MCTNTAFIADPAHIHLRLAGKPGQAHLLGPGHLQQRPRHPASRSVRLRLENYERLEALIEKHKQAEAGRSFRAFMQKERIGLADKLAIPAKLRNWGLG